MGGISSRTNRVFMFSSVRLEMPSALQGPYSGQAMAKPPADQAARQVRGQANRSSTIIASMDSMARDWVPDTAFGRSEEHTSELQSRLHLVCRLLLEKK